MRGVITSRSTCGHGGPRTGKTPAMYLLSLKYKIMLYDMFDRAIANELNVDVETYIKKIESTTEKRREAIILAVATENPKLIKKAKRIFCLIK